MHDAPALALIAVLVGAVACSPSTTAVPDSGGASVPSAPVTDDESAPPVAEPGSVEDTYHGVTVADPYRWLEQADDPQVQAWSDGQDEYARAHLDTLPGLETLSAELRDILGARYISRWGVRERQGHLFAMESLPPQQQPYLVALSGLEGKVESRVLVDPNALDPDGLTHIDWYVPSPDGKLLAVSLTYLEAGEAAAQPIQQLQGLLLVPQPAEFVANTVQAEAHGAR